MVEKTTISITHELWLILNRLKDSPDETLEDIIWRLYYINKEPKDNGKSNIQENKTAL